MLETGFHHGDFRDFIQEIGEGSVDLVLTDPVYENLRDYRVLLHLSWLKLAPDSAVLMFASTTKEALIRHEADLLVPVMQYTYTLNYIVRAKPAKLRGYNLYTWRTPVLWYRKGKGFPHRAIPDTYITSNAVPDGGHRWNKNVGVLQYWIEAFTEPGDLVLDPFCGSGSVAAACKRSGRAHISIDIDGDILEEAQARYDRTPVPLMHDTPEGYQLNFQDIEEG